MYFSQCRLLLGRVDLCQNCQALSFRKSMIPPPAKKITQKNQHLSARKSYPGSNFHLSTRTVYNHSMKLLGAQLLVATYKQTAGNNRNYRRLSIEMLPPSIKGAATTQAIRTALIGVPCMQKLDGFLFNEGQIP